MQFDRKLICSIGSSRNSMNWMRTEIMWSQFVERLRIPQRMPETYEDYMKLSKRQQGELKDIGGFAGGSLNGTRRKASVVTGRDLITLDLLHPR